MKIRGEIATQPLFVSFVNFCAPPSRRLENQRYSIPAADQVDSFSLPAVPPLWCKSGPRSAFRETPCNPWWSGTDPVSKTVVQNANRPLTSHLPRTTCFTATTYATFHTCGRSGIFMDLYRQTRGSTVETRTRRGARLIYRGPRGTRGQDAVRTGFTTEHAARGRNPPRPGETRIHGSRAVQSYTLRSS